jgi:phospholipase C
LLVISPFAKRNSVDHNLSNLASIPNLVEYNWGLPAISGSADQLLAGSDAANGIPFDLAGLFDFSAPANPQLLLDPTTGQRTATPTGTSNQQ